MMKEQWEKVVMPYVSYVGCIIFNYILQVVIMEICQGFRHPIHNHG